MVHPLVITAAATAGVGAVVAFEIAVFKPWREENWPHGFGEGVRSEFLKLRREVEQAVTEIQDDLRTLRDGRRRRSNDGHRRLSDDELDDFRRGVGEEASSERAQHEFEMHERQASAYRERLRASMSQASASASHPSEDGLRRRRRSGIASASDAGAQQPKITVPVIDVRSPASPELPHHKLGDASPSVMDTASLGDASDSRFNSVTSRASDAEPHKGSSEGDTSDAARNGLLGLDFSPRANSPSQHNVSSEPHQDDAFVSRDPFASIVDDTASSWHAVFDNRTATTSGGNTDGGDQDGAARSGSSEEGHVELDTNGLSQTLSEQHMSGEKHRDDGVSSVESSPYRSNRALDAAGENADAASARGESEPDFEVISDTADSEARWSHLEAPPSPTISSASEALNVTEHRAAAMSPAHSDAGESWAELSEPSSDGETSAGAGVQSSSVSRPA